MLESLMLAILVVFLWVRKRTLPITFKATVRTLGGGWLVGSAMDDSDKRALAANPDHLTMHKIIKLSKRGTPDSVIIEEIQKTHSMYQLNSEIIGYLKKNKIGDAVINQMRSIPK